MRMIKMTMVMTVTGMMVMWMVMMVATMMMMTLVKMMMGMMLMVMTMTVMTTVIGSDWCLQELTLLSTDLVNMGWVNAQSSIYTKKNCGSYSFYSVSSQFWYTRKQLS